MPSNEDYEKIRKNYPNRLTRGRAIKLYCKSQCCLNDYEAWKNCTISHCFLWNFRMGKEIIPTKAFHKKAIGKSSVISPKNTILARSDG